MFLAAIEFFLYIFLSSDADDIFRRFIITMKVNKIVMKLNYNSG